MSACTFFGHRDSPDNQYEKLYNTIEKLITNNNVTIFYIGTQGNFDSLAHRALKELRKKYTNIKINRVLAYMPKCGEAAEDSIIPEGIELVHPKYAISWRNKWMIEQSDYIISFISHSFGGAAEFVDLARKKNKVVLNLYDDMRKI